MGLVSVGDLNGDAKADLVIPTGGFCCGSQTPYVTKVYRNTTGREFGSPSELYSDKDYFAQDVADLNGDGLADVVAASPTLNELAISLSSQNGMAFSTRTLPLPLSAHKLVGRDFDGDGRTDIAVLGEIDGLGRLLVLRGNGDGTFAEPSVVELGNLERFVVAADFDGDKAPDLVLNDGAHTSVYFNRSGTFSASASTPIMGSGTGIPVAGDLDEDGLDDLVTFADDPNMIVIAPRRGGVFEERVLNAVRTDPLGPRQGVVLADFDADGHLDVVIARGDMLRSRGEIEIWRGDGTGAIGHVGVQKVTSAALQLVASDVDGDGLLDIVMRGQYSTEIPYLGILYGPCGVR